MDDGSWLVFRRAGAAWMRATAIGSRRRTGEAAGVRAESHARARVVPQVFAGLAMGGSNHPTLVRLSTRHGEVSLFAFIQRFLAALTLNDSVHEKCGRSGGAVRPRRNDLRPEKRGNCGTRHQETWSRRTHHHGLNGSLPFLRPSPAR